MNLDVSDNVDLNRRQMKLQHQSCNPETKLLGQWQDGEVAGRRDELGIPDAPNMG